ncbi:MAG TPA: hypothetical protein VK253_03190 [Candidatus Binatia bacterium]|nr:hypothetical protein [Candidatus Binatia bacterium]
MNDDHYYYDENGDFIIQPPENYDPIEAKWEPQFHICTKCFATCGSNEKLQQHSASCNPKFKNIIYQDNDHFVAYVNSKSSDEEKRICEWLMTVEADETNTLDSVTCLKWPKLKYHVFLLLKKSTIIAVAVLQKGRLRNESGKPETFALVTRIFTLHSQRRKGYMEKLLSVALETLNSDFSTAVFQEKFSKNGEACLTGIAKKRGLKSIRTIFPPWINRITPFPIP